MRLPTWIFLPPAWTVADLQKKVGQPVRTVPQIFVGKKHVGGYTDFL
ncbi:hypothetical protein [uncultured Tolumonas sp.]